MKDRVFADTNIVIYVFDKKTPKQNKAREIVRNNATISSQVIIESLNVCIRKLKLSKEKANQNSMFLLKCCQYYAIEPSTFITAYFISKKYGYSHLDSLIIASALEANCTILYSEDLQHNQLIEKKLRIVNPFL
ncbi:MAG: PIN domain-containing protein [Bacteroidota bacterium]